MKDEIMNRFIKYLEGINIYCGILENYYQDNELDDFDKGYLDLFYCFKEFIEDQINDSNSPLMRLAKNYQEFIVEYKDSLLHECIAALNSGYNHLFYKEGKKEVYLKYLESKYSFNGEDLLNKMSKEEFYDFESNIFDKNYIKKVIGRWLNDLN